MFNRQFIRTRMDRLDESEIEYRYEVIVAHLCDVEQEADVIVSKIPESHAWNQAR